MADEMKRVGLVLTADGAVDFKKTMKEVNAAVAENYSTFKLAKSQWDENTKASEKLADRQKYLAGQTDLYTDKVTVLSKELKEMESAENRDEAAIAKKKAQLNQAKAKLNEYKSGLEEVNKELKNGTANLEQYAEKLDKAGQKATSAGKTLSKGVTAPIVGIGAAAAKAAMELDEGYDTIISKTGATGKTLEDMQKVADNVFSKLPVDMADVGAAVGEINTRFGFTGDELEKCSEKFLKFAQLNEVDVNTAVQLVSRAMEDAGIESSEYGTVLDELTAAMQASGIGFDTLAENLAKFGAPMRQLGFDTESSIAIFAQWEKAGVNTEIAFSGMKKAIANWTKEGKDGKVEFANFVKGVQDGSISAQEALEVFGTKAGPDLVDAIQNGRFNYEEFLKIIQSSSGIVDQSWDEQQDAWDKMKVLMNNLKKAGKELGETLFEVLAPIIDSLSEKVKAFAQWFDGLSDSQKKTIVTIAMVVAAVGPMLIIFGTLASSVSKIITLSTKLSGIGMKAPGILTKVGGGFKAVWGVISANPVTMIITIVLSLIAVFVTLYEKCEWFRDGVNKVFGGIKDFLKGCVEWFKKIMDFEWKLPEIKLPHFSIDGGFSLAPPEVPKLKVKWYAKGGILNSPTIFGANSDGMLGGGEAGKEAVLPIDLLKRYIREENAANNAVLADLLIEALSAIKIEAENNIYIGDTKLLDIITEMVINKIGGRQSGKNLAMGVW